MRIFDALSFRGDLATNFGMGEILQRRHIFVKSISRRGYIAVLTPKKIIKKFQT